MLHSICSHTTPVQLHYSGRSIRASYTVENSESGVFFEKCVIAIHVSNTGLPKTRQLSCTDFLSAESQ